jgi:hypothetical protein
MFIRTVIVDRRQTVTMCMCVTNMVQTPYSMRDVMPFGETMKMAIISMTEFELQLERSFIGGDVGFVTLKHCTRFNNPL